MREKQKKFKSRCSFSLVAQPESERNEMLQKLYKEVDYRGGMQVLQ